MRRFLPAAAAVPASAAGVAAFAFAEARSDPVRRHAAVALPGCPAHCRQVVLPLPGPVERVSRYPRYDCGLVREGGRTVVTGAGIDTSGGPFRLGAPPDRWLLTLGPPGFSRPRP